MAGCGVEVFMAITFGVVIEVFKVGLFPLVKGDKDVFGLLVVMGVFVFFKVEQSISSIWF
jgi:hypothetical protein